MGPTTIEVRLPGMPPIQCLSTTIGRSQRNCVPASAIARVNASSSAVVVKLAEPTRKAAISMSEARDVADDGGDVFGVEGAP